MLKKLKIEKKKVKAKKITTKSFQKLMEKRLTKLEIAEIEHQAMLEARALKLLQNDITAAMTDYMKEEKIGFSELVRRLDVSPAHVAKIKKGAANLTLASVARLFALLGQEPRLVFNKK
jgi:transcriptional regulator with XRE-family HTH domain